MIARTQTSIRKNIGTMTTIEYKYGCGAKWWKSPNGKVEAKLDKSGLFEVFDHGGQKRLWSNNVDFGSADQRYNRMRGKLSLFSLLAGFSSLGYNTYTTV